MDKFCKLSRLSQQHNQELVEEYEKLRTDALDQSKVSASLSSGFFAFLFRGMVSWLEACQAGWSQTEPSHPETIYGHQPSDIVQPLCQNRKEITMILTNMVLSHQKKLRKNYV